MADRKEWKPNPKQEVFLALPTTIKEAAYGGGAGSGKSDVLLIYPLARKWYKNPKFKQVFMRRTYPELRNEIVPRSRELYLKFGASFNKSDMAWTFPREDQYGSGAKNNGSIIYLAHCEDENDVHKYDSMEINLFTPDEVTSFTEYIYLYIGFTRTRTSDPDLPAIIRTAGMPGGIGHTWFKKRMIDPYKDICEIKDSYKHIIIGRAGSKRIYIHATQADNDKIDPTYAQSLATLPDEAERKAKLYGDWDAYLGQVFDEFRDHKYPDEPDNALHVIEPFNIPSWWPRLVAGDWGMRAMTWIGFAAISPDKRVYIYRELWWRGVKIEHWAPEVKKFIDDEQPRKIKFCKSAGQDRGQEHTIQQQIAAAVGYPIELTFNSPGSRVAGKNLLHEYLRWKPKPILTADLKGSYSDEHAMWIWRNRGEKEYRSYLAMFQPPEPEVNIPKLQIFSSCPVLIETIKSCSYPRPRNNKPVEDIAEFDGDDPYDGLRYIIDEAENYFETAIDEFARVQKQEKLIQQLTAGEDFTAYYRNMRALENESEMVIKPVGRYKH